MFLIKKPRLLSGCNFIINLMGIYIKKKHPWSIELDIRSSLLSRNDTHVYVNVLVTALN